MRPIVGGVRAEPKHLMVKKQVEMQQEEGVGRVNHRQLALWVCYLESPGRGAVIGIEVLKLALSNGIKVGARFGRIENH